jgi:hypothetical protein
MGTKSTIFSISASITPGIVNLAGLLKILNLVFYKEVIRPNAEKILSSPIS